MSRQLSSSHPVFRLLVKTRLPERARNLCAQLPAIGIAQSLQLQILDLYFLQGELTPTEIAQLQALICDPVIDQCAFLHPNDDGVAALSPDEHMLEVTFRAGVTDNVGRQLLAAAHRLGIHGLQQAATGKRYLFRGQISPVELHRIARGLLVNETIQQYALGAVPPPFGAPPPAVSPPETIPLRALNTDELMRLSHQRRLALDRNEMQHIQRYFERVDRDPTDAELETIAQTWSEHCVHKTFKARIHLQKADGSQEHIPGLIHTFLQAATRKLSPPWLRSAFVDNAGVIAFDEEHDLSFKVETHNHPSAIEPFGGANTGVGGVVRDLLGVSHRPIAVTDVLCFGPQTLPHQNLPQNVLHPQRVQNGVVAGVADYGNKLGLPTVNGTVLYHPGYTANPLVYCGCVGLGKRGVHPRQAQPGDRIIVLGGRTGRDGLRGATFSSLTMDTTTAQVSGSAVQIGDPITEKGLIEVVTRAAEAGLYHAITDCGAGGLSSAVGEMAEPLGARVELQVVPLKYAGLAPWEIWLSEAQERMVLAVPPENLPTLQALCETYGVEMSDIGVFEPTGRLRVFYNDWPVVDLENAFLHTCPQQELSAIQPKLRQRKAVSVAETRLTPREILAALLGHPNIASKEAVIRVYDHEVRGATVIKPLTGPHSGPSDAAVLKPLEIPGWRGFVLSNGVNPYLIEADPYLGAVSAVDEAIRNAVATGADPDHLALLDNFCWGDPRRPETLGTLVEAARACHAAALHYRTPFISGKDSLNNEYLGADGKRHAIPGTLLISAIAIHPDVRRALTLDFKSAGNHVYLLGDWYPALAGAHVTQVCTPQVFPAEIHRPPAWPENAPTLYRALHRAIHRGLVRSLHDLSEGGLAVAAAEMALSSDLGATLSLDDLHPDFNTALFAESNACLLAEIAPQDVAAFTAALEGLPFRRVGSVTEKQQLTFTHGTQILSTSLDDLRRWWRASGDTP